MKQNFTPILLTFALLFFALKTHAQTQNKTEAWLESKLLLWLDKSAPISDNTTGGEVIGKGIAQVVVTETKNEGNVLTLRRNDNKASGYSIVLKNITAMEVEGNTVNIVTQENSVSFLGSFKKTPKKMEMIKVPMAYITLNNVENAKEVYKAIGRMAKTCGAKLVADDLFEADEEKDKK